MLYKIKSKKKKKNYIIRSEFSDIKIYCIGILWISFNFEDNIVWEIDKVTKKNKKTKLALAGSTHCKAYPDALITSQHNRE